MTTERLATLLNDIGLDISKRQLAGLLIGQLDGFAAEDAAVLHAGLVSSSYVTVDDTGARHSHNPQYNTYRRPKLYRLPHHEIEITAELPVASSRQLPRLCAERRGFRIPGRALWQSTVACRTEET